MPTVVPIDELLQQAEESFKTAIYAIQLPPIEEMAPVILETAHNPSEDSALRLLQKLCKFYNVTVPRLMTYRYVKLFYEGEDKDRLKEKVNKSHEKGVSGRYVAIFGHGTTRYYILIATELVELGPVFGYSLVSIIAHEFYHHLLYLSLPPLPTADLQYRLFQITCNFAEAMASIRGDSLIFRVEEFLRKQGLQLATIPD